MVLYFCSGNILLSSVGQCIVPKNHMARRNLKMINPTVHSHNIVTIGKYSVYSQSAIRFFNLLGLDSHVHLFDNFGSHVTGFPTGLGWAKRRFVFSKHAWSNYSKGFSSVVIQDELEVFN